MTTDTHRPRFHFTPRQNWINDPNGLVWFDGEYHLFFQYNPHGDQWGHMSWGHAVSPDLVRWTELPLAIPEDERVMIFSGSIVVDRFNTSGFGAGPTDGSAPVLVACYTGCRQAPALGQAQELAFSRDRGRTWTKYAGNPVLDIGKQDFRDPKVFWHAPTRRWVMAVVLPDEHIVQFHGSPNLRDWTLLSAFGPAGEAVGIWECPDLIHLPATASAPERWVLKMDTFSGHPGGTGAQVFVGSFDGERFTPDENPGSQGVWADHGSDFYAALSWSHLPPHLAAPVWIGWMNNHAYAKHTPTQPWRGAMSVPRELFLRPYGPHWRLAQRPWAGLKALRGAPQRWATDAAPSGHWDVPLGDLDGRSLDLEWTVDPGRARSLAVEVRTASDPDGEATRIGYDTALSALWMDRSRSGTVPEARAWAGRREAPLKLAPGEPLRLRVLVDRCSVEVFSLDGQAALTELIFPDDASRGVRLLVEGGSAGRSLLTVWPMGGAALSPAR